MSGDPASVQLDVAFRNFLFMRGQAVKDTRDALTELITNSVDAYRKIDGYESMDKYIYVTFHYVKNQSGSYDIYLQCIDHATGVNPEDMRQCFLSAGNKTASEKSRGFFSTGAKNITIFGDVHYTSVVDDQYSKVYLDDMSYGHIVTHDGIDQEDPNAVPNVIGIPVTSTQREALGLPGNGMNVVLAYTNATEILKLSSLAQIDEMLSSIGKIATMRDIFADPKFHIYTDIRSYAPHIDIQDTTGFTARTIHTDYASYDHTTDSDNYGGMYYKRITYTYPQGNLLLNTTFKVPNYPHYEARFVMYKTPKPIEQPERENQMEFGFLIKDSLAVHEVNTLGENDRYRWNPNINYIYGYVFCDGFNAELQRYDAGETTELIIDPNRVGGINHEHSLYKSVLSVCVPRLDKAIKEVQAESSFKSINIDELDTIVNELEGMGVEIFDSSDITFNFVPDDEGPLAISLRETENHIVKEISGETNLRLITTENLVLEELEKAAAENDGDAYVYYYNDEGEVEGVPTEGPAQLMTGDQLQELVDSIQNIETSKPFIYRMSEGDWTKVEVYQRGKIDRLQEHDDSLVKIKHKSLTIQFIKDINYKEKYIVDTTNGVTIKINLHNEIVADKLSKTKIDNIGEDYAFKLSDEASYDALNFLETLMISAFTDIIVNNDIMNGRIAVVDGGTITAKKIVDHRNKVEANIEVRVHQLFAYFIAKKKQIMMEDVHASVDSAKTAILEMFTSGSSPLEDIEQGAENLVVAIENSIYTIMDG